MFSFYTAADTMTLVDLHLVFDNSNTVHTFPVRRIHVIGEGVSLEWLLNEADKTNSFISFGARVSVDSFCKFHLDCMTRFQQYN